MFKRLIGLLWLIQKFEETQNRRPEFNRCLLQSFRCAFILIFHSLILSTVRVALSGYLLLVSNDSPVMYKISSAEVAKNSPRYGWVEFIFVSQSSTGF